MLFGVGGGRKASTTAGRSKALFPLLAGLCAAALAVPAPCGPPGAGQPASDRGGWHFTEVSVAAGVAYEHGFDGPLAEPEMISGGVAAGDYDGDGWADLYVVTGDRGPNLLFRNRGDGTFEERGEAARLNIQGDRGSGPAFADLDGDGRLDLVIGGVDGTTPRLFRNREDGTFEERTDGSGLGSDRDTFSTAFGDYDRDGDLDLFQTHWGGQPNPSRHLWRNDGGLVFTDADAVSGIGAAFAVEDYSFTPAFTDLDGDGWADLVLAADFGTSKVWRNRGDGTFEETTGPEVTDENGMGSAVADFDRDGDLDWFVSSILDPDGVPSGNWGVTGNRLYRNRGDGTFDDATDAAGMRHGFWGWGSCFADLDNDGWLDLFHVNGIQIPAATEFHADPSRLFHADGAGGFVERAAELGLVDTLQGRGVACFDYDRDGDVDLFVANNNGPSRLFRNDGGNAGHYLEVALRGLGGNTEAIGARVWVTAGGVTQLREITAGSNFVSQNPAEAHFGLGGAATVDELRVRWPDGEEHVLGPLAADRLLVLDQAELGQPAPAEIPAAGALGLALLAALLGLAALIKLS
jgi:hypothetical protein